jgi:hypothetical protein
MTATTPVTVAPQTSDREMARDARSGLTTLAAVPTAFGNAGTGGSAGNGSQTAASDRWSCAFPAAFAEFEFWVTGARKRYPPTNSFDVAW